MGTLELLWMPYFAAELKLHRPSVITRGWNVLKLSNPCLSNEGLYIDSAIRFGA